MFEGKHKRYNMIIFMHNFLIFAFVPEDVLKDFFENSIIIYPHLEYKRALRFDIDITIYLHRYA